jgi:uridine kinase
MGRVRARVIVLAGPSGAGKSRLAIRLGLPVLRLDDFYKDGDDPTLPLIETGANHGLVDWDHPDSWHLEDALAAIRQLCETGVTDVPVYDIASSRRTGTQHLDLGDAEVFVTEGIFAAEVIPACTAEGLLAAAYCITQHPLLTFWRRLTRDLREHRKPPLMLLRRGWALLRAQRRVVAQATSRGAKPMTPDEAYAEIHAGVGVRG